MMISIGHRHFIESGYIVEILKASDTRAASIAHAAAETGMLINATDGRRVRSTIKLKSQHIVLSALGVEALKSRLGNIILSSALSNRDILRRKQKNHANESNRPEFDNRRIEPDRRRFSYTHHIPERRSGARSRRKDHQ
jgi:regulator of extracellular matrix RemA (YlzA/DUF370 family)